MTDAPSPSAICQDCLIRPRADAVRCPACGGPRIVAHAELDALSIAHVDCDAFYAAIEKRDRPELRDEPVIIGGGRRGVVATACYIARIRGVRSAMPMFRALELCPEATIVRPDMTKYAAVGHTLRDMMRELTPAVEPLSIDEAFLDLTGTERLHGEPAAMVLARLAERARRELGITVSIGLSDCKFLAKLASDLDKPRGFSVIGRAEAPARLAVMPVGRIWGVGDAMRSKLERDGIRLIGQLQHMDRRTLVDRYGEMGLRLHDLSRGHDVRHVNPARERKSVSAETTFREDLRRVEDLRPILRRMAEKVSLQLKAKDVAGRTVVLKLKTANHRLLTRRMGLDAPTQLAERLFRTADRLLAREIGPAYRLIGVGAADLCGSEQADPVDLVDASAERMAKAERAVDAIRARFGAAALLRGENLERPVRDAAHPYGDA